MNLWLNIMGRFNSKTPRKAKNVVIAKSKEVRADTSPSAADHLTIVWKLSKIDWKGPWGQCACTKLNFIDFLDKTISSWESMTWTELFAASGGRTRGNNHHPIKIQKLSKSAKDRLVAIYQNDIEELYSLRISGTVRLYGIRDSRAFQILWYDPWHDNKQKGVCPSTRN